MAATVADPPDETSPWLHLAAPVGRVATYFLIGGCFLQLFAPLAFLADVQSQADPTGPGGNLVLLLTDPGHLLSIGDFLLVLGTVILVAALLLVLLALARADRRVSLDAFLLGAVALACLATYVPAMILSEGLARGTVGGSAVAPDVGNAAATGGWGLASVLLLVASLAYLFFALRVEKQTGAPKVASLRWPVYAAVNVLGSAAIAGFFSGGGSAYDVLSLGFALRVTLIPLLDVMAYADLRDRFPAWKQVRLHEPPKRATPPAPSTPAPPPMGRLVTPIPPPPPPDD